MIISTFYMSLKLVKTKQLPRLGSVNRIFEVFGRICLIKYVVFK